jgi:hypothetical protein
MSVISWEMGVKFFCWPLGLKACIGGYTRDSFEQNHNSRRMGGKSAFFLLSSPLKGILAVQGVILVIFARYPGLFLVYLWQYHNCLRSINKTILI